MTFLRRLLIPVLLIAITSTLYLYNYPAFQRCSFPRPPSLSVSSDVTSTLHETAAPFRFLVLADPQLEGDSSLPSPSDTFLSRLQAHYNKIISPTRSYPWKRRYHRVRNAVHTIFTEDIPRSLEASRKSIDLFGNDFYLAHVYRTMRWWSEPTHVAVLGDLIGSQWVGQVEFERRAGRYWDRVFRGGKRIDDRVVLAGAAAAEEAEKGEDNMDWSETIINVAGNHDIGYAGDISSKRLERFERAFGPANWDFEFTYPVNGTDADGEEIVPKLHLVNINSMLLDTPALEPELQAATYDYINGLITHRTKPVTDSTAFTLLLTHVPLWKKEGMCVDQKLFTFFDNAGYDDEGELLFRGGGLREQNHLSDYTSTNLVLNGLFGMSSRLTDGGQGKGRNGLIMTGHDHEGCDIFHYIPSSEIAAPDSSAPITVDENTRKWHQTPSTKISTLDSSQIHAGIREITLRSMMGEYGGHAVLLSLWFDFGKGKWEYDVCKCAAGIQHIWWAVHIVDLIAGLLLILETGSWALSKDVREKSVTKKVVKRDEKVETKKE